MDLPLLELHGLGQRAGAGRFKAGAIMTRGKRLFGGGGPPAGLRLVDSRTSTTGVIIATYERHGDVPLGSFLPEVPSEAELRRRAALGD